MPLGGLERGAVLATLKLRTGEVDAGGEEACQQIVRSQTLRL